MVNFIITAYKTGGKVVLFGNGGSAADAQHLTGELVGRFELKRQSFPAIALTTNTSVLTAVANDYGYDAVFSRQIEALVNEKDVVGFDGDIIFDESKPDGAPRKLLDSSKIRRTGWTPKIGFEKGTRQTYEWYINRSPGCHSEGALRLAQGDIERLDAYIV